MGYRNPVPDHPVHYGLPSPWLTVIFSLDDGVEAASSLARLPTARPDAIVAAGLHTTCSYVLARPGQTGVQLAVHPLACQALFGVPAAELGVSSYDGAGLLGRGAVSTQERLTETTDWPGSFRLLDGYLRRSLDRDHPEVRSEVRHAWHLLERSGGRAPIGAVAAAVGVSTRHLNTLVRQEVGRSPKQVAQLIRFHRAVTRVRAGVGRDGRADLSSVAAATGYADQSHLTRDFVDRLGVPPSRWISEEL